MANRARGSGPTAERVAENVRALRRLRGMDLSDLAARLERLGQPIGIPGLSRLENGDRRVDVDDLVALAVALDVTPTRLLLPGTGGDDGFHLTPELQVTQGLAWEWAVGAVPMWLNQSGWEHIDEVEFAERFRRENQPHVQREELSTQQVLQHYPALAAMFESAKKAVDDGLSWNNIHNYIEFVRNLGPLHDLVTRQADDRRRRADGQSQ